MLKEFALIGFAVLLFGSLLVLDHYILTVAETTPLNQTQPGLGLTESPLVRGENVIVQLDWLSVVIMAGLSIAVFASAFYIRTHPFFGVITLFYALVWFAAVTPISNVWEMLMTGTLLSPSANNFPLTSLVMLNYPLLSWILGLTASLVFYGKSSDAQL